jgi:hypothetical protein
LRREGCRFGCVFDCDGNGAGTDGICGVEGPAIAELPFGSAEFRSTAVYNDPFSFCWNPHHNILQLTLELSGGSDSLGSNFNTFVRNQRENGRPVFCLALLTSASSDSNFLLPLSESCSVSGAGLIDTCAGYPVMAVGPDAPSVAPDILGVAEGCRWWSLDCCGCKGKVVALFAVTPVDCALDIG